MTLRPFKFVVQAVLLEEEDGKVTAERPVEPVVLYGADKLADWANAFEDNLKKVDGLE